MANPIEYRDGYKYQLVSDYEIQTPVRPRSEVDTDYIALSKTGWLTVKKGYAWDGVSGPVIDTSNNLRASLVHDALYQLMRLRKLGVRSNKDRADKFFRKLCKEDGVPNLLAQTYYVALKNLGKPSTEPESEKKPRFAPEQ
jgi:hypothetical protein